MPISLINNATGNILFNNNGTGSIRFLSNTVATSPNSGSPWEQINTIISYLRG